VVQGPSVSDLIKAKSPEVDNAVRAKIELTMDAMGELYRRGVMVESYDQMIGEGNEVGNATVQKVVDSCSIRRRNRARSRRSRSEVHQVRRVGQPGRSEQNEGGEQIRRRRGAGQPAVGRKTIAGARQYDVIT
jgi:hypothetical protein